MSLPNDVARCAGASDAGVWREGCEDCQRRTDRPAPTGARMVWMGPPPVITAECEYRIEPEVA